MTKWRWIIVFAALFIVGWAALRIIRAHWIEAYRRNLVERGFPESYAEPLSQLQYGHPDWRFEPLVIDDLTWMQILDKECTPSWNLVARRLTKYYAEDARAYDSGAWYQASRETIAYFMDPRNFLNECDIFMFETLGYDEKSQTTEAVARALAGTFMANANYDGGERRFAELITEVGRKVGVSPVFLAGRLASEQGGGSPQAFGKIGDALAAYYTNPSNRVGNAVVWGKRFAQGNDATTSVMAKGKDTYNGYYNFFNFRAYGLGLFEIKYNAWVEATAEETVKKYLGPWNSQARAIEGGSQKIKELYIDTSRHTRYLQKFSVSPKAGNYRWKQYMQNISAPLTEARNTARAYAASGSMDAPYRFVIPVYREMPDGACVEPAD